MRISFALLLAVILLGVLLDYLLVRKVKKSLAATQSPSQKLGLLRHTQFKLLLPAALLLLALPTLPMDPVLLPVLRRGLSILIIVIIAWSAIAAVLLGRQLLLSRYDMSVSDNLNARAVHTQVNVLVKITLIIISVVAASSIIMMFENIRQLGTSILASAGVLGIIVGFAAQRSIAALLAGLQIALTQPIRLDDVVIVEGEWGQIEEIALTYVVVRIWDLRRLVVPTNYFLEKPFQNWTRTSADLLGTATFHVDYSLPVDVVRSKLREILEASSYWDGKVWRLHVINATDRTVELRALMSAKTSSDAWELRCEVREALLDYLQAHFPDKLPKLRAELLQPESQSAG